MPEIGTSASMSEDGKRGAGHRSQATAPVLDSTEGAMDRWAKGGRVPEGDLHCVTTSRLTANRSSIAVGRVGQRMVPSRDDIQRKHQAGNCRESSGNYL